VTQTYGQGLKNVIAGRHCQPKLRLATKLPFFLQEQAFGVVVTLPGHLWPKGNGKTHIEKLYHIYVA
jgi:hypothetical protein